MSRSGIILAAHGANANPATNVYIAQLADRLRHLDLADETTAAFHQGEPTFASVLDGMEATRITAVPVMTSEGYYTEVVLRRELTSNRRYHDVELRITRPVGTHPGMAKLIARRFGKITAKHTLEPHRTTLAIVGHGTPRHRQSRAATVELVQHLRERGICGQVLEAFLDEQPTVETILDRATQPAVVVIPFLIGDGPHASQDIPRRMGPRPVEGAVVEKRDRPVFCDHAIGLDKGLLDIIVDLVKQADAAPISPRLRESVPVSCHRRANLRLGTRGSAMALWQARYVEELLRKKGMGVEIVQIATSGDEDLSLPIEELPSDAPFTDAIDSALTDGRIDLAVHCLKDLPTWPDARFALSAVLPRADAHEAWCLTQV